MLNAQELKVATQSAIRRNIMDAIKEVSNSGRFNMWLYYAPENVITELESLGYKVDKTTVEDGHVEYKVSWE